MRDHNPHPRSTTWSVWIRSVTFVVAALCMAFTEGHAPSAWQSGVANDDLKAADKLEGCGICYPWEESHEHVAVSNSAPQASYGPGDHGWHPAPKSGTSCDILHGLCVSLPKDGEDFSQADAGELTDAISQAAAEHDIGLLVTLLGLPDVYFNSARAAIQVAGCDGITIAGHVPVGANLLEAAEVLATEAFDSES